MIRHFGDYRSVFGHLPSGSEHVFIENTFDLLFEKIVNAILDDGGKPDYSSIRIIYHTPEENESPYTTVGVRIDAEYEGVNEYELETSSESSSGED
jgi:hypothetical protein